MSNIRVPMLLTTTPVSDTFGNTAMTSESESEAEESSSPPENYRESKIFFDVAPKESQPLFRHPTPTPKQLKVLKANRTSYLNQENGATAVVPVRTAPPPPNEVRDKRTDRHTNLHQTYTNHSSQSALA